MAAMKPRTGDGPMEAVKEGRLIIVRVPLEGGGRLVVSVNDARRRSFTTCSAASYQPPDDSHDSTNQKRDRRSRRSLFSCIRPVAARQLSATLVSCSRPSPTVLSAASTAGGTAGSPG